MEYLWFIALGLGVVYLMFRNRGGMGCWGVGHGDHHSGTSEHNYSSDRASGDPSKDVIDLREDQYTIIAPKNERLPSSEGAEHRDVRP
jgi:hypothetical protein